MSLPCLDGVGVLATDVRRGLTKAGKRWAGATVRFASRRKAADGSWADDTVIFVSVVGFDLAAEELAAFKKGDTLTVVGNIKALGIWKPERGEPRPSLEMFCEHAAPPPPRHAKAADRGDTATVAATAGQSTTQPTDLNAYRRESTDRLKRQHTDNAQRAGRLT